MSSTTQAALEQVRKHGPSRVVINCDGFAVTPRRALAKGHEVAIVFVRNDGWTLGAETDLAGTAFKLWPTEWVGFIEGDKFHKIENYTGARS